MKSELDRAFFALSDPTRRTILECLHIGPASITALARTSELTVTGTRKHIGVLEGSGLVVTEKVGRVRECRLGPTTLGDATAWIEAHRRAVGAQADQEVGRLDSSSGGRAACRRRR